MEGGRGVGEKGRGGSAVNPERRGGKGALPLRDEVRDREKKP